MERIICPCKGCEARCAGCHGSCEKYLEWKEFDAKERKWLKDSNGISAISAYTTSAKYQDRKITRKYLY